MHLNLSRLAPPTGALLACVALLIAPQIASAAPAKTALIYIGGVNSQPADPANWTALNAALPTGSDWYAFSYSGTGTDQPADTCQPIATSETLLRTQIEGLRGKYAKVALVGHSLGGVLAFDVGSRPDEADFVSTIVTVDAPIRGISAVARVGFDAYYGSCPAIDELRDQRANPAAQAAVTSTARTDVVRGQRLMLVSNQQDGYLLPSLGGVGIHALLSAIPDVPEINLLCDLDSGDAHSAALRDPATVQQIAQFISA